MNLYRKAVAARHPLAGFKVYGSGRHRRPDMHSEDRIHAFQRPAFYIFLRFSSDLLRHLEDQLHGPVNFITVCT